MRIVPKGFYVGATVAVAKTGKVAKVRSFFRDIRSGVELDRTVNGLRCWNAAELRVVPVDAPFTCDCLDAEECDVCGGTP